MTTGYGTPRRMDRPGDAIGVPLKLVRKEALARADAAETPAEASARHKNRSQPVRK